MIHDPHIRPAESDNAETDRQLVHQHESTINIYYIFTIIKLFLAREPNLCDRYHQVE